jgi:acyl-CoA synthetase (AMP-forming)/AMP-acid ligase II
VYRAVIDRNLMVGLVMMLSVGAKIVMLWRFGGSESLDLMVTERATLVFGIATTYLDQPSELDRGSYDLSAVRLSFVSDPLDLCQQIYARFSFCVIGYGMTETAAIA